MENFIRFLADWATLSFWMVIVFTKIDEPAVYSYPIIPKMGVNLFLYISMVFFLANSAYILYRVLTKVLM